MDAENNKLKRMYPVVSLQISALKYFNRKKVVSPVEKKHCAVFYGHGTPSAFDGPVKFHLKRSIFIILINSKDYSNLIEKINENISKIPHMGFGRFVRSIPNLRLILQVLW